MWSLHLQRGYSLIDVRTFAMDDISLDAHMIPTQNEISQSEKDARV